MSGIFFNEQKHLSQYNMANKAKGQRTLYLDNYRAAKDDFYRRYRSDSKAIGFAEVFNEEWNKNKDILTDDFPNPLFLNHPDTLELPEIKTSLDRDNNNLKINNLNDLEKNYQNSQQAHYDWYFDQINQMKKSDPVKYADLKTREQVDQEVIDKAKDAWGTNKDVMANAEPGLFGWNWGQIAAGARAGITDPYVLATLPISFATFGYTTTGVVAMQFLKTFAVEAVLGMVAESAIQVGVYDWNNSELGIEHSLKQSVATIVTVGVASGTLSAVVLGLFKSGAIPFAKYQEYKIAKDPEAWLEKNLTSIINKTTETQPEVKTLIMDALSELPKEDLIKFVKGLPNNLKTKNLYRFLDMEENKKFEIKSNPFKKNTENDIDHLKNLEEAKDNFVNETIPIEEKPVITLDEGVKEYSDGFVEFKIDELEVDANLFQYKEGGDAFGVTDRLKDVTEWNPHASNSVMVYEFADGRKVIADGHQRLGLAKRILAQNDGQKPKLVGMLYREADGYSPDQIKIWAAIKNIQEGSGTSIDAAKILRISKKNFEDFKGMLPKRSNLVKEAMAMEGLSDDAFDLVIRGQFSAAHAAMVASLVKDKSMHKTILQLLKQTDPSNIDKARSIILQAMDSGTQVVEQTDLLGTEFITKSLFTNKADILDTVIKGLKADKNLFKRLNLQKTKINSSGKNVLDESYNKNRELINEKILQFIQKQATRSGNQLADDLNIAAKLHAEGNESAAIKQFEEAIDRANVRGDFDGYDVGGSGSVEKSPIQNNRIPEEEDLSTAKPQEEFSDIGGTGQKDQGDFLENEITEVLDDTYVFDTASGKLVKETERGEFSVDAEEVLKNSTPIDRKIIQPILDKIDPEILADALAATNKIRKEQKLPEFKNLSDALDDYEKAQLAFDRKATTESIIDTPERIKIQNEAVEILDYNAGHSKYEDRLFTGKPNAEKKIVFVMGKPGSGKSVIEAIPLVKKLKAILVDVDEAKKLFPEYDDGKGAGVVHEESGKTILKFLERVMTKGQNVVFPVVGKDFDALLNKITGFKEMGYKVYLHNIDIPGDESYRRAFVRYLNTGRLIPHEYLLSIGDNPNIVYNQIKKIGVLDGYKKTDNFVKRGEKPILIENEGGFTIGEKIGKRSSGSSKKNQGESKTSPGTEEKSLNKIITEFENKGFVIDISENIAKKEINLSRIIIPKEQRNQGLGSKAMDDLIEYADQTNQKIVLTPSKDFGATSINRLKTFYKNKGFVENKGINKDFSTRESFIYNPKQKTKESIELSEDQKLINEFKDEEFSVSSRVEEEEIVADMITAKQALEDINNDQAIINRLRDCVV